RRNTQSNNSSQNWDSDNSTPTLIGSTNSSSLRQTPISGSATPQPQNSESTELRAQTSDTDFEDASRSGIKFRSSSPNMFRQAFSSVAGLFRSDANYTGLGQYPGSSRKLAAKSWLRLAAIILGVVGLGYFGLAAIRSYSASPLGRSSDAANADPRLQSIHCDVPHPGRPLVQYVLMLDAGSTGSRIHVYKFNYCKSHPELEDEIFQQSKPGLSSFGPRAEDAARSLDGLMEAAMKGVPENLRSCTPIAVKATAGLRLLPAGQSDRILEAVENRLKKEYPFKLIPKNPVEVMSGTDEGIYAWITVNFLLGSLGDPAHKTAATFDLGGGSTQIVFEPRYSNVTGGSQMAPGKHKYSVSYSGQNYTLYQHSYLGYGLMSARKNIKLLIAQEASNSGKFSVEHPCFPPGFREEVALSDDKSKVTIIGPSKESLKGKSALDACYKDVRKILHKDAPCAQKPCSFNGVYQPELDKTFASSPFYIFSYFYDRTYPLGVRDEYKLSDIKALGEKVCKHSLDLFAAKDEQEAITDEKGHYCLDLVYQYSLLRDGVGMPENRV
ncbi:Guanosine-diphosphatase, partial [Dipsacomyces acuminosporus]